jgi:hypothetical protein
MINRITALLLFIGLAWGQADLDKLVLKDGTTYFGEYSKIEGMIVYFKPHDAFTFQPISIKQIQTLKLKDGHFIIDGGKVKNSLTLEEYQKLSTKEKGIYDAKSKNLNKWALYMPTSAILFVGCMVSYIGITDDFEFWENPIFLVGSSAASLIIPYFVLNNKEKNNFPKSILTDSEKEIYKQAYSKKLRQRKFIYAVGSCIVAGVIVAVAASSMSLDMSGGFGGGGGNWGMGGYSGP